MANAGFAPQLEADLVVALASGAVGHSVCARLTGDLYLPLGNERSRYRRAQQVDALVLRVRPACRPYSTMPGFQSIRRCEVWDIRGRTATLNLPQQTPGLGLCHPAADTTFAGQPPAKNRTDALSARGLRLCSANDRSILVVHPDGQAELVGDAGAGARFHVQLLYMIDSSAEVEKFRNRFEKPTDARLLARMKIVCPEIHKPHRNMGNT